MPFYEVLKFLILNPGKYRFRRTIWDKSDYNSSPAYITSSSIIPNNIKVVGNYSNNRTLEIPWSPSSADIAANDWYEVE